MRLALTVAAVVTVVLGLCYVFWIRLPDRAPLLIGLVLTFSIVSAALYSAAPLCRTRSRNMRKWMGVFAYIATVYAGVSIFFLACAVIVVWLFPQQIPLLTRVGWIPGAIAGVVLTLPQVPAHFRSRFYW